jgi:uncharacterized protein HemY
MLKTEKRQQRFVWWRNLKLEHKYLTGLAILTALALVGTEVYFWLTNPSVTAQVHIFALIVLAFFAVLVTVVSWGQAPADMHRWARRTFRR